MSILITGATSARAYQLKSSLSQQPVLLGDYAELPAPMLKAGNMLQLPHPNDSAYNHKMLTLCLDNGIGTVYVLNKDELNLLNEAIRLFDEYGISILAATE